MLQKCVTNSQLTSFFAVVLKRTSFFFMLNDCFTDKCTTKIGNSSRTGRTNDIYSIKFYALPGIAKFPQKFFFFLLVAPTISNLIVLQKSHFPVFRVSVSFMCMLIFQIFLSLSTRAFIYLEQPHI